MPHGPFRRVIAPDPNNGIRGDRVTPERFNELQRALEKTRTKAEVDAAVATLTSGLDGKAEASDLDAIDSTTTGLQAQLTALTEALDAIVNAPTELPVTAGLAVHLDAQTLAASDQDRIAAWTNLAGGPDATQATSGNQPMFALNQINGKPAVLFDTDRNDNMVASALSLSSTTPTIFAVVKSTAGGGTRYILGTNVDQRNMYMTALGGWGGQASGTGAGTISVSGASGTPTLLAGVWNGSSSLLRANGIQKNGTYGAQSNVSTAMSIGHRTSLAAGSGMTGAIGEVLLYDRVLTTNEIAAVEAYLAARWGFPPATQQTVWYVDSVTGTAGATGRTPSTAMASLAAAAAAIREAGTLDATVIVHAPESTPLRETATIDCRTGGIVRLINLRQGESWHCYGSVRHTSGWTSLGGGVYSKAIASLSGSNPAFVATLLDGDGQTTQMRTRNTSTPTTPAAGEYGYDSGTYYIHLPGNANPNEHTIEIALASYLLFARESTEVTIQRGELWYASSDVVRIGTTSSPGRVLAWDTGAEFGGSGWTNSSDGWGLYAVRCRGNHNGNNGFGHNGTSYTQIMELVDCEGAWNADEGVSGHTISMLILRGGEFHHNAYGGMTNVGSAIAQVWGTEFHHNRLHDPEVMVDDDRGGVSILEQSQLISKDMYVHDHPGPGIEVDTAAGASWTDNGGTRSGVEHGNGLPDAV